MIRFFILIILTLSMMSIKSYGQDIKIPAKSADQRVFLNQPKLGLARFLDPAKVSMSHRYSMGFGSGRNGSSAISLYTNTLAYQISPDMLFRVNLGVQSVLMHTGNPSIVREGQTRVIPGFDFIYRPRDNMLLHISYGTQSTRAFGSSYQTWRPGWAQPSSPARPPTEFWDICL